MRSKSIRAILLVLISSVSLLMSCGGGGGGGTPPPPSGEGSPASPLNLGTVSATLTHSGSVGAYGTSFYTFTTGTTAGSYTMSLTNTHSDLSLAFADPGFTSPIMVCDNVLSPGANDEICPYPLTAGTTYYLAVDEWDTVAGTYTLTISPPPPPVPNQVPPLAYNFDDGTLQGWTTNSLWSAITITAHSGTYSVNDSPAGNYSNGSNTWLASPQIDLTATTAPKLTFWHRYQIESCCDDGYVELSTNGGSTWTQLRSYSGTLSTSFTLVTIDLTPYKGSSQVVIRFRLQTDISVTYDGWYIDDIGISVN